MFPSSELSFHMMLMRLNLAMSVVSINAILPWPEVCLSLVSAAVSSWAWKKAVCESRTEQGSSGGIEDGMDGVEDEHKNDGDIEATGDIANESADISGTVVGNQDEDGGAEGRKEKDLDINIREQTAILPAVEF